MRGLRCRRGPHNKGEVMKAWMIFGRAEKGSRAETAVAAPAYPTRKQCKDWLVRRNDGMPWRDIAKDFVIRKVNIEVEY